MKPKLAKSAVVAAALAEAAIMAAGALATNSVAEQSGDRFRQQSLRGNISPGVLVFDHYPRQRLPNDAKRKTQMEKQVFTAGDRTEKFCAASPGSSVSESGDAMCALLPAASMINE